MNKLNLNFALLFSVLTLSQISFAGSDNIGVDCKSQSGRTVLKADVPGDSLEAKLSLKIDKATSSYINQDLKDLRDANQEESSPNEIVAVISTKQDFNKKVFNIEVKENNESVLSIKSVPNTLTYKEGRYGTYKGTFSATLSGKDPRETGKPIPNVKVKCTYSYDL